MERRIALQVLEMVGPLPAPRAGAIAHDARVAKRTPDGLAHGRCFIGAERAADPHPAVSPEVFHDRQSGISHVRVLKTPVAVPGATRIMNARSGS
jgi:hypothetical protein